MQKRKHTSVKPFTLSLAYTYTYIHAHALYIHMHNKEEGGREGN